MSSTPVFGFDCPEPAVLILTIVVTVILTPIVEETINRGFVLQALLHRGRWQAILVSALLFAIFHRPHSIVLATIVGIYLAVQFLNTRTLWACTITHGTYNAVATFDWSCVRSSWNPVEFN